MPDTGNKRDANHLFLYFYNQKRDLVNGVYWMHNDKRNWKCLHVHKACTASIQ